MDAFANTLLGFVKEATVAFGAGALASMAIVWLAKTTISTRLKQAIKSEYDLLLESHRNILRIESDSKLEMLKSELKSKGDVELERLRSALNIEAAERQVHVAGLYGRRADALHTIYSLLTDLQDKLIAYVNVWELTGTPSKEELRKEAAKSYEAFNKSYKPLLIYVPATTALDLQAIEAKARHAYNRFAIIVQGKQTEEANNEWLKINEFVNKDIRSALSALEDDFRAMLDWRMSKPYGGGHTAQDFPEV
jgi:hypothetical protein